MLYIYGVSLVQGQIKVGLGPLDNKLLWATPEGKFRAKFTCPPTALNTTDEVFNIAS